MKSTNPFERIQSLGMALMAAPAEPAMAASPPSGNEPFANSPDPGAAPAATLPDVAGVHWRKEIRLGLAAAVKNCAAHDLGTSPENIPEWVQFTLPYDMVTEQLSTGRVIVPLDAIVGGLEPPIRALFSQARAGYQVELPANEVFHAISETTPAPSPSAAPVTVAPDPFTPLPENKWKEPAPPAAPVQPFWNQAPPASTSIPPMVFGSSPLAAEPQQGFAPFVADPAQAPPPANSIHVKARPVVIPANPATGAPEFVTPAPLPPARGSLSAVATPRGDNQTRRLLLTVLLGSPDACDAARIIELTRRLPGVSAALCVQNGRMVADDGDGSPEADRFRRDAPSKISGLSALAALTGIEDTETLHIQSGQGEATFCLQGDITFAVLHDPRNREPALKEKITLLGRELAAILHENAMK